MAAIRSRVSIVVAIACAAIATGIVFAGGGDRAAAGVGELALRQVGNFAEPVHIENAPGARKLLFVVEQRGTIAVLRKGKKQARPFLDIQSLVSFGGEEGLLSLAFDPDYKDNRRFYVYYVNRDGDIQIDRFRRRRGSPMRAGAGSRRTVLIVEHPDYENHNGGQLQFGPDGFLYLGTGDGGSRGDPDDNAQNPDSLLGKLLRIAPLRKGGYTTPDSNPFATGGGAQEIYALGLRNPFRFSFDRATGDLTIGDVGQSDWEEIDHLPHATAAGANFGWDNLEGNHVFEDPGTEPPNYQAPIHEYEGGTSVIAGYVVRDPGLPALFGRLVYADLGGDQIRSLDPGAASPTATDAATGLPISVPTSFGEGVGGRIYVASLDGPVYRIVQG